MKKYQVMIEDTVASQALTLDEMLELGLLDEYDEHIKVRALDESKWQIAREYPFHISEASSESAFVLNGDGSVTRKKKEGSSGNYTIDEYGQVIRRGSNTQSESSSEPRRNTYSSTSTSSSNDDNSGCVWAVIVGIGIMVLAAIL